MTKTTKNVSHRRDFLKTTAGVAAASTLASVAVPRVHAAEDNTIRLALIGSGSAGSGATAFVPKPSQTNRRRVVVL